MNDNNEFTLVSHKKRSKKQNYEKPIILNKESVIKIVNNVLIKYRPYAAYLYGSVARCQNNENSDVDIFVIWKKIPNNVIINQIYDELYDIFKRKIDFVNYQYNNKSIKITYSNKHFIQNVINDAVSIIEPSDKGIALRDICFDFDNGFD